MREDWIECELNNVIVKMTNGSSVKQFSEKIGLPISRIETIWNEKIDLNRVKYIKENEPEFIEKYRLIYNDILFSHINSDSHLGKTAIYKNEINTMIHGINLLLLRPLKSIRADFLLYQFRFLKYRGAFIELAQRSVNQSSINQRKLKVIKIIFPPLPEQRAIVAKIEALFSDLDNGIASLKKAQAQLKIYRQAVLKKAFEGELTKEWREKQTDLPSAEVLLEQIKEERQAYYEQQLDDWKLAVRAWEDGGKVGKKPRKPRKLNVLPKVEKKELQNLAIIPNKWSWDRAENIMKLITNGTTPKGGKVSQDKQEVPFLKIHNLSLNGDFLLDYKTHYISKETSVNFLYRSIIFPDDVLLNTVGPPLGKVALVTNEYNEYNCNQNVTVYRTFDNYLAQFLKYYLLSPLTMSWIKNVATATSGQSYMNLGHCRNLPLPIVNIQEQNQIVQEIESRLSVCDQVEKSIQESLDKAASLRQSILKKAFEGKLLTAAELEACRQEKDWEPASVLLERIKEEKAQAALLAKEGKKKGKRKKVVKNT